LPTNQEGFRQDAAQRISTKDNQLTLPKFLTVEEVAELLRVSPRSVYDWVSQEVIPFHKAGRRTIFLLDEILEWTSNHSKEPTKSWPQNMMVV
jgi:excisionase family DNA binding protein